MAQQQQPQSATSTAMEIQQENSTTQLQQTAAALVWCETFRLKQWFLKGTPRKETVVVIGSHGPYNKLELPHDADGCTQEQALMATIFWATFVLLVIVGITLTVLFPDWGSIVLVVIVVSPCVATLCCGDDSKQQILGTSGPFVAAVQWCGMDRMVDRTAGGRRQ
jgi:hypothetical protein